MNEHLREIKLLCEKYFGKPPQKIIPIAESGSDRKYSRVFYKDKTAIATYGNNLQENETYFYFAHHFAEKKLSVPKIFAISDNRYYYLQQDVGSRSLLDELQTDGYGENVFQLYKKSLSQLAKLQIEGDNNLDYTKCFANKVFDKRAVLADLFYFKFYFLDTLQKPYNKFKMMEEFENLSETMNDSSFNFFMFRDFQSRNILVDENKNISFIDFQGGMKGALQYDVASLLWQAKANLPLEWKQKLLEYYIAEVEICLNKKINQQNFIHQYHNFVLLRLLQVLGAYGFRGLFENKTHFLESIPNGLQNLKTFLNGFVLDKNFSELKHCINLCTEDETIKKFSSFIPPATPKLVVSINSFSYRSGIPADNSENGGGFVFDCRGILNPGRIESMKQQTGKDKEVKDYLEHESNIGNFLRNVFALVDLTVENYLSRDFTSLQINFGCTGGQHRSVYCAEATAEHLSKKYGIKIILHHIEQERK